MVAPRSGTNLDRESVRVRLQKWPGRPSPGNAIGAKACHTRRNAKKTKTSPPPAYAASMVSVAMQNLVHMVAVTAVSGAVLLTLLAAKHF